MQVATIRLYMDGSFFVFVFQSPVEVNDDHAFLSSCAVEKQGCAACNVGKGEKQTSRIGRNCEVFPVCIRRAFILTVDEGKHGTSSGGCAVFVLDGLARQSHHVCAVFVLVLCPGSVLPQSRERLYRQWTRGRHGTSSGGCAAFLVNINGV